jgi:hypothetical protein
MSEALVEIMGAAFPVSATPGAEPRARSLARMVEHARDWLSELLRFEPQVRLQVLDEAAWAGAALAPAYGIPHTAGGDTVVASAGPSELFDEIRDVILEEASAGPRAQLFQVYGDPPNLSSFVDLLAVHELAHLYHEQVPFTFPTLWLEELFADVALEGYVVEALPAAHRVLETLPRAGREIRPDRIPDHGLERFGEAAAAGGGLRGSWFRLRLHEAAIGLWEAGGRELVQTMYERFRDAPSDQVDLGSIDHALAAVPATWPD